MYVDKVGIHFPGNSEGAKHIDGFYDSSKGMEYELWEESGSLVMGASHDAVGLVTWYYVDQEYWDKLERESAED